MLVIDIAKRELVDTIALDESPEGMAVSSDGKFVAVASEITNSVAFVSTATRKKVCSVPTKGKNPEYAEFSPDGNWLYVSAEEPDSIDIVDVACRRQVSSLKLGPRPRGIGFTP